MQRLDPAARVAITGRALSSIESVGRVAVKHQWQQAGCFVAVMLVAQSSQNQPQHVYFMTALDYC